MDMIPYNVKELFAINPALAAMGLLVAVILLSVLPWHLAHVWSIPSISSFFTAIACTAAVLIAVHLIIATVIPTESIDDLVGTPVLNMRYGLERALRFIGLAWGIVWSQALGISLGSTNFKFATPYVLNHVGVILGLVISYAIIVVYACTDNITELLVANGSSFQVAGIPSWFLLTGVLVHITILRFKLRKRSIAMNAGLAIIFFAISLIAGWFFITSATAPHIVKYGETFSALQFLLEGDRASTSSQFLLFTKFAVVHLLVIAELVAGSYLYRLVCSWASNCEEPGDAET